MLKANLIKFIAIITTLIMVLSTVHIVTFAAPNTATVTVDAAITQGELFRMEKYNNWSGVNTYSLKPEEDIPFLNEVGLNTKIMRIWVSDGFYDFNKGELNTKELEKYEKYLYWTSQMTESILVNFTGGGYVANNTSDEDIKRSLKAMVQWMKSKYPKVEYIECLNEPDNYKEIKDTPGAYYRYYKNFYQVINELNAENHYEVPLKIGGPAIMTVRYEPGKSWMPVFLRDYAADPDPNKRLDFISYHVYSYPDNPSLIKDIRPEMEKYLRENGLSTDIPSFITETGLYPGQKQDLSVGEDQMTMAAGMIAYAYYWMESDKNVPFQWVVRHSSEERKDQLVTRPDYPTRKLTMYGNVMLMMSKMKKTRISATSDRLSNGFGVYGIAAMDETGISVVTSNYQRKNKETYETKININNLPQIFDGKNIKVKKYVVDYGNSNFYFNRDDCNLKVQSEVVYPGTKNFSTAVYLAPNANVMLVLEPTDEPVTETGAPISIYINDIQYSTDVEPVEISGRTLVPIRLISETLGSKVQWDEPTQTVTISRGTKEIKLTIGNTNAFVSGSPIALDVPAQLINGRTMVPVRFISENMDCTVEWAGDSKSVLITSPNAVTYADLTDVSNEPKPLTPVVGMHTPVDAFATATDGDNIAKNAIDYNSNKTFWSSGNVEEGAKLILDFGKSVKIDGVFVAFTNGKGSIATFDIAVSDDNVNWTTVATNLESSGNTLDTQIFALPQPAYARYVAYVGKGNTLDKDNSLLGFGAYGVDGTIYEAENATAMNTVTVMSASDYASSGGKFVDYGDGGSYIEFNNIQADTAGQYTMTVVYAIGSQSSRKCTVTVNGTNAGEIDFQGTSTWENWQTAKININLNAGSNTIRITSVAAGPNIDYIMISK